MGEHGSILGQADAYGGEVDEAIEVEVEALVGQAGITYGGTDALEMLCEQVVDGEFLVGGISPVVLADGLVSALCGGFGQAVGQRLAEQVAVFVGLLRSVLVQVLDGGVGSGAEDSYAVA